MKTPTTPVDSFHQNSYVQTTFDTESSLPSVIEYNYTNKYPLPIRIWRDTPTDTIYHTDHDWDAVKNSIPNTALYFDPVNGIDDLGRGTITDPLKSLKYGHDNYTEQDWKLIAGGVFDFDNGLQNTEIAKDLKLSIYGGTDKARVTVHKSRTGWTPTVASGGTTWEIAEPNTIRNVVDMTWIDEFGQKKPLYKAANAASCYVSQGTYFQVGGILYVHTFDTRMPDDAIKTAEDMRCFRSVLSSIGSPKNFYFENIEFWGGVGGVTFYNDDVVNLKSVVLRNCSAFFSSDDLISARGNVFIACDHVTGAYGYDIFDCTAGASVSPVSFEYYCFATYATNRINTATTGYANNASTVHNTSKILRVGGFYSKAEGHIIGDIQSIVSINIGVTATDSLASLNGYKTGFGGYGLTTSAAFQLFDCKTSGNLRSINNTGNQAEIYNHSQTEPVAASYIEIPGRSLYYGSGALINFSSSFPQGGVWKGGASNVGAIKITLPVTGSMVAFKGTILQYGGVSTHFMITCRPSAIAGGASAVFSGKAASNYTVRTYNDGGIPVIYIGETNSIWAYAAITIEEVQASFNGTFPSEIMSGWSIGLATSFAGTLGATIVDTYPYGNLNQPLTGYTVGLNTAIAATDPILTAWGKVQAQLNARVLTDTIATASNANYTVTSAPQFVKLPAISAARTVTLPVASSYAGLSIKIWNQNTSGFSWTFASAIKDALNANITAISNGAFTIIESDGINWIKIN